MNYADFALIRFGSGLSPRYQGPATPDALMDSLADDTMRQMYPSASTVEIREMLRNYGAARRARKGGEAAQREYETRRDIVVNTATRLRRVRLARAVEAPVGFGERLAQFWASHFSMNGPSPYAILMSETFQDEVIRTHQTGRFADLLRAATLHPAMLNYLNQSSSVGPGSEFGRRRKQTGLNENHARELLELHTLGAGEAYNQQDIRQLAELMTGVMVSKDNEFIYAPQRAEPGPETVLGKEYGGAAPARLDEVEAFLDDLAVHPQTAAFICRKLARHFCADAPPDQLVEAMTARFRETGGDLTQVYAVMVSHNEARETFGQKVRQPFDLLVAGLRSLGVPGEVMMTMKLGKYRRTFLRPLAAMGQSINGAPQPEGWPEDEDAWLTPQRLAARIDWSLDMPQTIVQDLPEVSRFVGVALSPESAAMVAPIVARAESQSDGIGLVLASPQFNRR